MVLCRLIHWRNNLLHKHNRSSYQAYGTGQTSTGNIPYGAPAFGQVLVEDNPNQHGTTSYYWVTSTGKTNTWEMYDDFTKATTFVVSPMLLGLIRIVDAALLKVLLALPLLELMVAY